MRTTVDIDAPILKDLKILQKKEGKSLGRLISNLLAQALHQERKAVKKNSQPVRWISKGMGARIDLNDKEALYAALNEYVHVTKGVNNP